MSLIRKEDVAKATHLDKIGLGGLAGLLMEMFKFNQFNRLHDGLADHKGFDFLDGLVKELNIRIDIDPDEFKHIPKEGPFITVSNHPFGMWDGILAMKLIGEKRPDFKVLVNFLLLKIEPIQEFFIPVNPFENKDMGSSILGMKRALERLRDGHPIGIFPAGEVSTYQPAEGAVTDIAWQLPALKLIHRAKVPIIPLYFHGQNSFAFHLLGMLHPALRTAKIPSEVFNKKNSTIKIRIGAPVSVKEQAYFQDAEHLGRYLRAKTYALGTALEAPKRFKPNLQALKKPEPIIPPVDPDLLAQEVEALRPQMVHEQHNFEVYITEAARIPHILREIGRLREETFRDVGEGTNRQIDLDEYDLYYDHLFVWDNSARRIAGAYRLGRGPDIAKKYGKQGFYVNSLFRIKDEMLPLMAQSVELGRSFVVKDYQQKPLPLFLLWKGLLYFLVKNPEYRYMIGPVSISNSFSNMSKKLLIQFITKNFFDHELAKWVRPRKKFEVKIKNADTDILVEKSQDDINLLDRVIEDIEPARFRIPVLLKRYIKQNARIVAFNVDPLFNNSLDGFMVLDIKELPEETISNLKKEFKNLGI